MLPRAGWLTVFTISTFSSHFDQIVEERRDERRKRGGKEGGEEEWREERDENNKGSFGNLQTLKETLLTSSAMLLRLRYILETT